MIRSKEIIVTPTEDIPPDLDLTNTSAVFQWALSVHDQEKRANVLAKAADAAQVFKLLSSNLSTMETADLVTKVMAKNKERGEKVLAELPNTVMVDWAAHAEASEVASVLLAWEDPQKAALSLKWLREGGGAEGAQKVAAILEDVVIQAPEAGGKIYETAKEQKGP
jgi:hypothetical protein